MFQVSTRQSDFGIGQPSITESRLRRVNFLPSMYVHEEILASQRPKEITTYDAIIIPFDIYTWCFTFGCIIAEFLLLIAMQNIWSYMKGTNNPDDFIFEGSFQSFLKGPIIYICRNKFQTFACQQNSSQKECQIDGFKGQVLKQEES